MDKQELYGQLPRIAKRLFTLGIGAAILFNLFWYGGGYAFWGRMLDALLGIFLFPLDIDYSHAKAGYATLVWNVEMGGRTLGISFYVNQLNSNMVVLATLLATWPFKSFKSFLKISGLVLAYLLMYQMFSAMVQLYFSKIGPDIANIAKVFWEDSTWYQVMRKASAFDKFILRYFAWLPIFLAALVTLFFVRSKPKKNKAQKKTT